MPPSRAGRNNEARSFVVLHFGSIILMPRSKDYVNIYKILRSLDPLENGREISRYTTAVTRQRVVSRNRIKVFPEQSVQVTTHITVEYVMQIALQQMKYVSYTVRDNKFSQD
jgi:hypothetical protein